MGSANHSTSKINQNSPMSRWTDADSNHFLKTKSVSMLDSPQSGIVTDVYGGMFGFNNNNNNDDSMIVTDDEESVYVKRKHQRRQNTMEFKQNLSNDIVDADALMDDIVNDMASNE